MKRRQFIQQASLGSSALILPGMPSFFHHLLSDSYEMKALRGKVGIFSERGGTIGWLISDEGVVVVDTQFPEQAGHLIEAVQKQTTAGIEYLINTHHHGDHTAGNIAFKGIAKNILAHENSKINQRNAAIKNGKEEAQLYPDQTFEKEWRKKVAGETIAINYWGAGHTNGDAIIHFENANVAHVGDLMFNRRYPYIDKDAGADIANWIAVLDQINVHFDDETILVFGHSGDGYNVTGGKEDIKAFRNYLSQLLVTVESAIKSGKSEEEIMLMESIPGAPEWKGDGIKRSLSAAYQELSA